ncbi:hypothetical protein MVEN_01281900 [Mycena venus]|uniref:Uncharacterized protein n=1 Tax=Mycena venus TaxID=2733690 RepID=A0A8H6XZ93_9AGAR|nr:hypothetical protein MVEN_01281900 [Mycena venus]
MSRTLTLRSWSPDTQILLTSRRIIVGLMIPGFGLTVILLALFQYAARNPVSRRYVDRVSFRLLTYALIAHFVFCITFPVSSLTVHPGWSCDLLTFITNLSLMFSAGIFFCIALNLPWDAVNETCWYRSTDPEAMLRWLIGTQTFWIVLFAAGEVVAFVVIIGYLLSYMLETRRSHADTESRPQTTDSSEASHRPGLTILMFRNIILRVALYPTVSCVLNLSTAVIDLYESRNYARKHPGSVELTWKLNLTDLSILAGRPLIYGLLAAIDPSFIRALRALRHPANESTTQSHDLGRSTLCLSTVIDIPPEETYREAHVRRYRAQMSETATIPRLGTTLEEVRERRFDEEQDQRGMTVNAPAPTQRQSIDVACHI